MNKTKSGKYRFNRKHLVISLLVLVIFLLVMLIFNIKTLALVKNKFVGYNQGSSDFSSNSGFGPNLNSDLSIQNQLYDAGNNLIAVNSKLPLLQFERKLPLELTLSDMYVLVHDDSNFTNFKLFSMNYITNLHKDNGLVNSRISDKSFFIVYCPNIDLVEVYSSRVKGKVRRFNLSDRYYTYKTGISCRLIEDSSGDFWEPLLGYRVVNNTLIKNEALTPLNFKFIGNELSRNLMLTYGITPDE